MVKISLYISTLQSSAHLKLTKNLNEAVSQGSNGELLAADLKQHISSDMYCTCGVTLDKKLY